MKATIIFIYFITFSSIVLGQNVTGVEHFFVNETLIDSPVEKCWQLTTTNQVPAISNKSFRIQKAEITNNDLILYISYGGGCGNFYLKVFVDTSYNLSNAPLVQLFPQFLGYDLCKALRYRKLCFDLNSLLNGRKNKLTIKIDQFDLTFTPK